MDARIDSNMEDAVRGINELSDAERQQCWSGLHDLQMKTVDARVKIQITVDSFRAAADKLDQVWRDCKIAHAAGTTGGIISGCLALGGIVMSGGAATPFLLAGLGFGVGGAVTNIGTSCVEASINSSEIEKAEKLWREALDSINVVTTTVQSWLDKKEMARIAYILYLAEAFEFVDPVLLNLLHDVVSTVFGIPINILKRLSAAAAPSKAGAKLLTEVGAQGGKGIAQLADDAAQVGKTGLQVADDMAQVGKAGLQASDDVAQAGAKAGSKSAGKYAGKVLIAANIAFLMVDCIDLGFTVRDLVKNKGSEAAKDLRRKAKQLEDLLKK
ncbi:apolipoprotein L3-like [Pocillopora verrucosa]|uniref:apolipoprotein L3-like n=1 Tax=Pocillopora verrucosa TaxID=203993 RepID=UPI00333E9BC8